MSCQDFQASHAKHNSQIFKSVNYLFKDLIIEVSRIQHCFNICGSAKERGINSATFLFKKCGHSATDHLLLEQTHIS